MNNRPVTYIVIESKPGRVMCMETLSLQYASEQADLFARKNCGTIYLICKVIAEVEAKEIKTYEVNVTEAK